jgi:hypothetical protein
MTRENATSAGSLLRGARPAIYIAMVVVVALGTYARQLIKDSIYACPASGYASDRYLAYCQADHYGDYEHGAFWFALEPNVYESIAGAQVLFMGNSRLQWGFSNTTTADWFASSSARYYLLGFSYYETYPFEEALLRKVEPKAQVYVINLDGFFQPAESVPARFVMHDGEALSRYEGKRRWQAAHETVCRRVAALCGNEYAVYRSRQTGTWYPLGGRFNNEPVSDDPNVDAGYVQQQVAAARGFLGRLPVSRECVILTMVPTFKTKRAAAEAIASELGLSLVAPTLDGLLTFDGSHLERASAERWSNAFLHAAGPQIRKCLDQSARSAT